MKLPTGLIRRLRAASAATAKLAAEKALSGERIADDLAQLKDYEQLIELSHASKRTNLIAAMVVGVTCFLVASLAWAVRIPSTKVRLTVVSDAVTIRLADAWRWSGSWQVGDGPFRIDEVNEVILPPEAMPRTELKGRAWLDVEKGTVALSDLEIGPDGKLVVLHNSPTALYFFFLNAPIRGQAQISSTPLISAGDESSKATVIKSLNLDVPVVISFYDAGHRSVPARMRVNAKEKIVWRNIAVRSLSFSREASGALERPIFVSGIESGTLTIGDTAEKVALNENDQLYLEMPIGVIQELELGPTSLRLSFEGRAKTISVGATGYEQNLTPTWLSYLYHQERLGLFWGVIAFLWGGLWSTRQILFK